VILVELVLCFDVLSFLVLCFRVLCLFFLFSCRLHGHVHGARRWNDDAHQAPPSYPRRKKWRTQIYSWALMTAPRPMICGRTGTFRHYSKRGAFAQVRSLQWRAKDPPDKALHFKQAIPTNYEAVGLREAIPHLQRRVARTCCFIGSRTPP
jgi:hypothetical protein